MNLMDVNTNCLIRKKYFVVLTTERTSRTRKKTRVSDRHKERKTMEPLQLNCLSPLVMCQPHLLGKTSSYRW